MDANLILAELPDGRLRVDLEASGSDGAPETSEAFAFASPLSEAHMEQLRWYLEEYLRTPYGPYDETGQHIRHEVSRWGGELFSSVFGPEKPSHSLYLRARECHAKLTIVSASASFLSLPWELLQDPRDELPLVLQLPAIDRRLSLEADASVEQKSDGLRILVVIARPSGLDDVSYGIVARPLFRRVAAMGDTVHMLVLRPPTFTALKERLVQAVSQGEPFHVLHFDGHGRFPRNSPIRDPDDPGVSETMGALIFENDDGTQHFVSADEFSRALSDSKVPIVILNACQSGTVGSRSADAAVATRLIALGTSSVVAMGYSVYASAAAGFISSLYAALIQRRTVSEAVTAGRAWLFRNKLRPSTKGMLPLDDWLVPIHYLRTEVFFSHLGSEIEEQNESIEQVDKPSVVIGPPPANFSFVGRHRAFHAIELAFAQDKPVLVYGQMGVGKTALAEEFAAWWCQTRDTYSSTIASVIRFGGEPVSNTLAYFIESSRQDLASFSWVPQPEGNRDNRSFVVAILRQQRALLILDGLHRVSIDKSGQLALRQFISECTHDGGARVLVLSRSDEKWLDVSRIGLAGLTLQESAELANSIIASRAGLGERLAAQSQELAELLHRTQGNPLAIRTFIPYLSEISPTELSSFIIGDIVRAVPNGAPSATKPAELLEPTLTRLPAEIRKNLPVLSLFGGAANWVMLEMLFEAEQAPSRYALGLNGSWLGIMEALKRLGLASRVGECTYRLQPLLSNVLTAQWLADAGEEFGAERSKAELGLVTAYSGFGAWLSDELEKGFFEEAFASLLAERVTLERLLGLALTRGMFDEATQLVRPLLDVCVARGALGEARRWLSICRTTIDAQGLPADLSQPLGQFWLMLQSREGSCLVSLGRPEEAYIVYDLMRSKIEASPKRFPEGEIMVYHQLGVVSEERGDLVAADRWYRKALRISKATGSKEKAAGTQFQLGGVEKKRGDLRKAERRYREALRLAVAVDDQRLIKACHHSLLSYEEKGDFDSAEELSLTGLEMSEESGNLADVGRHASALGQLALSQYQLKSASKWLHTAYNILERIGDKSAMASVGLQLGLLAQKVGNLELADRWYQNSKILFEKLGNNGGMARSLHQLGMLAEDRKDQDSAEALYKSAIDLKRAAGINEATTLAQLGALCLNRGNVVEAERYHREALRLNEAAGDRSGIANTYHSLGLVAFEARRLDDAESLLKKSLKIKGELSDARGRALSYGQLGLVFEVKGDSKQALDYTVRSANLYLEHPDPGARRAMLHLVRLTEKFGMAELQASWKRTFLEELPPDLKSSMMEGLQRSTELREQPDSDDRSAKNV
jgi:tetratricopeptide (TPR) repeat protein